MAPGGRAVRRGALAKTDVKELAAAKKRLDEVKDLRRAAADLFWTVLNSREFVFNH